MVKKLGCFLLACSLCFGFAGCVSSGGRDNLDYTKTIVDNNDCTFKITGIDKGGFYGYTLKVYLENKTNVDLMFSVDEVSVNGYMIDPVWASSVSAGKKSNSEISWFESDFEENGIVDVTEIEFKLVVYDDNDDWDVNYRVNKTYTITPPTK